MLEWEKEIKEKGGNTKSQIMFNHSEEAIQDKSSDIFEFQCVWVQPFGWFHRLKILMAKLFGMNLILYSV